MEKAGANEAAVNCFLRAYDLLEKGTDFNLSEEDISPAETIPHMEEVLIKDEKKHAQYLSETVVIKLNGGLGTGMGLEKAKSLLEVKEGQTFLDLIARQNAYLRKNTGEAVKFLLMNSYNTSEETNEFLKKYPEYAEKSEVEMLQNFSPKVLKSSLEPATWDTDPKLEWCPPGHGDIYTVLYGSGWLDKLLEQGVKYAFISNSDNLGATVQPSLLTYFVESNLPFLMEVTKRTPADSKGGHLCMRNSDGQLQLREIAQCEEGDLESFQDINKHKYFNTNNLWLRLDVLKETVEKHGGFLPLPIIINKKTLNPRESSTPEVYQLETAMGAAIDCFPGASAVCVPRSRFAPVKKTSDLLSLRSDAYEIHESGRVMLIPERNGEPPVVKLSDNFKLVEQMESLGNPSLKEAHSLSVEGNVKFKEGVVIKGNVSIVNGDKKLLEIPAGTYEDISLTPDSFNFAS